VLTVLIAVAAGCERADQVAAFAERTDAPGRATMHRLNRIEYNNTVRDLLGTSLTPADLFPPDDVSHGFDNIADVLSISPVQVEMYHHAAKALIDDVMSIDRIASLRIEAEDLGSAVGAPAGDAWKLVSNGEIATTLHNGAGTYRIVVLAWSERPGPVPIRMAIRVNGADVQVFDVLADATLPGSYEARIVLVDAPQEIAVAYVNDRESGSKYRNLLVDSISIEGPLDVAAHNLLRDRIMICNPATLDPRICAREIVAAFGRRAWRHPLGDDEIDRFVEFISTANSQDDKGSDDFATGISLALRAMLASPQFLFRIETDPDPASRPPKPLNDYELASRLSYFLWSTMPDEELFAVAATGTLGRDDVLRGQVERMLADPMALAFVDNFAGQWLSLRGLDEHEPDADVFPAYDMALKNDMVTETKMLFQALLNGNRPVHELLTADFTYANARLAAHYGLRSESDGEAEVLESFERLALPPERSGLLGHASMLTVTSNPTRTSPVKRGKWVLEQLLCTAPPPPPPGVAGLQRQSMPSASLRERMESHRADPLCAACHTLMDPIGFGLENFDGTGRWRELDGGFAIDASGALPGEQAFEGGVELAALLAQDARFPRCVVSKLYTYALGRAPTWDVSPFTTNWLEGGAGLNDLVVAIATSQPFRQHRTATGRGS
jgi:hypothetical protein